VSRSFNDDGHGVAVNADMKLYLYPWKTHTLVMKLHRKAKDGEECIVVAEDEGLLMGIMDALPRFVKTTGYVCRDFAGFTTTIVSKDLVIFNEVLSIRSDRIAAVLKSAAQKLKIHISYNDLGEVLEEAE